MLLLYSPLNSYLYVHWILDFKLILLLLFKSYCVNIYGSQIWKFYNKEVNICYTAWRKAICQIYKLPYRTPNILINHIIQCYPIDIILEKNVCKVYNIMCIN